MGDFSEEGFEGLPVENSVWNLTEINVSEDLTITSDPGVGIFDAPHGGVSAIEGDQWLDGKNETTITFTFAEPITSFGFSIIDWGDQGNPGTLSLTTNAGDSETILSGLQTGGGLQEFFGLVNQMASFTTVTLETTSTDDGWGIDRVVYAPEPSMPVLFGVGLIGLAVLRREEQT